MSRKKVDRQQQAEERFWGNLKKWTQYWRQNPQRFCTEYFGLHLHLFQKLLIYLMNYPKILTMMFWASRGLGRLILLR